MTKYFFGEREFLVFPYCVSLILFSGKTKEKKLWNQLFSNLFSKTVTFRNFLQKKVWDTVWKNEKFSLTSPKKNFVKSIHLVKSLLSRNFCKNTWERISVMSTMCEREFSRFPHCEGVGRTNDYQIIKNSVKLAEWDNMYVHM